jgi:hypothetical protein
LPLFYGDAPSGDPSTLSNVTGACDTPSRVVERIRARLASSKHRTKDRIPSNELDTQCWSVLYGNLQYAPIPIRCLLKPQNLNCCIRPDQGKRERARTDPRMSDIVIDKQQR